MGHTHIMSDLQFWLALNIIPEIGPVVARRLLSVFGNPEIIFSMPAGELRKVEGVGATRVNCITGFSQWDLVRREIDTADKKGVQLVPLNDPHYPEGLRRIHGAPLVLYMKGAFMESDKYAVAMVGSRASTAYGKLMAGRIAEKFGSSGLTVVSGLARGIDTESHKGALKGGGRTIAVLGSGIDVPYPAANRGLMGAIEFSGAVISEFPFGTPPNKPNFPRRNRIISALSLGTVVVEAALDSGSLITVGYALEQGKEVYAVPGNATSGHSRGTNDLIKKGAKLVERAEEVIEDLGPQLKGFLNEEMLYSEKKLPAMSDDEASLYRHMSLDPKHIDDLTREINVTSAKALSILLRLELKGIVRQSRGKHFSLN